MKLVTKRGDWAQGHNGWVRAIEFCCSEMAERVGHFGFHGLTDACPYCGAEIVREIAPEEEEVA